jgi:FlgN protein
MSTIVVNDASLGDEVIAHLDTQLVSARRLLQLVLEQGTAIRARDVQTVVAMTGMLQAEMQRRTLLEDERSQLLDRAGARLGVSANTVTITLLEQVMDRSTAAAAAARSSELRGLLDEVQREHRINRALMQQELAFLDHLLRLADGSPEVGYDALGDRPTATPSLVATQRRVFDLEA